MERPVQAAALRQAGVAPTLAIVRVGERPEDLSYERGALKRCEKVGIAVKQFILSENAAQEELLDVIARINGDGAIHGCLLFRPLPGHMDEELVCAALSPAKDVDGITTGSLAAVFTGGRQGYPPCTARACMELLDYYGYDLTGRRAVVVGRSLVIGRPVGSCSATPPSPSATPAPPIWPPSAAGRRCSSPPPERQR